MPTDTFTLRIVYPTPDFDQDAVLQINRTAFYHLPMTVNFGSSPWLLDESALQFMAFPDEVLTAENAKSLRGVLASQGTHALQQIEAAPAMNTLIVFRFLVALQKLTEFVVEKPNHDNETVAYGDLAPAIAAFPVALGQFQSLLKLSVTGTANRVDLSRMPEVERDALVGNVTDLMDYCDEVHSTLDAAVKVYKARKVDHSLGAGDR